MKTWEEQLKGMAGVVICPGFGQRGTEGKIVAAEYTRTRYSDIRHLSRHANDGY